MKSISTILESLSLLLEGPDKDKPASRKVQALVTKLADHLLAMHHNAHADMRHEGGSYAEQLPNGMLSQLRKGRKNLLRIRQNSTRLEARLLVRGVSHALVQYSRFRAKPGLRGVPMLLLMAFFGAFVGAGLTVVAFNPGTYGKFFSDAEVSRILVSLAGTFAVAGAGASSVNTAKLGKRLEKEVDHLSALHTRLQGALAAEK